MKSTEALEQHAAKYGMSRLPGETDQQLQKRLSDLLVRREKCSELDTPWRKNIDHEAKR
jgi:hypothetical protein